MESAHRRASGAAARRKILTVPKSEWIFMRVVPVRTKTFSIRRLDGDRFGCGATLTRGSGVPGQQLTAAKSRLAIYISGKSCNQAPAVVFVPGVAEHGQQPCAQKEDGAGFRCRGWVGGFGCQHDIVSVPAGIGGDYPFLAAIVEERVTDGERSGLRAVIQDEVAGAILRVEAVGKLYI